MSKDDEFDKLFENKDHKALVWIFDYLSNTFELIGQGIMGIISLAFFPVLVPLNFIYGLYRKIICDVLHRHKYDINSLNCNYCYYCRRMKDEIEKEQV